MAPATSGRCFCKCNSIQLKHDPEKWKTVFERDHAQKNLGRDPI